MNFEMNRRMNLRKREEAAQFTDDDLLAALHFITTGERLQLATLRAGEAKPSHVALLNSSDVCPLAVNEAGAVTEILVTPVEANRLSKRVRKWNREWGGVTRGFTLRIVYIEVDRAATFYKIATRVDDDAITALLKQLRGKQARRRGRKRERVQ